MKAGMSNREALPALRHARAHLAPLAGQGPHRDTDPRLPSRNNGGDGHNNDGTDPELERPRDRPSETIDDVRQVNEELPSHYTGEHAEIGKALDDGYGLIDDPTHHFGTNPETGLPNSYNDQAEKYQRNETDCYWPESSPNSPVTNGMNSGSIKNEHKIDNYIEKYGDRIDRIGDPRGKYFGAIDGDHIQLFREIYRSQICLQALLPVSTHGIHAGRLQDRNRNRCPMARLTWRRTTSTNLQ